MRGSVVAVVLFLACGCGKTETAAPPVVGTGTAPAAAAPIAPSPPAGMVPMLADAVREDPTRGGVILTLTDPAHRIAVPIFIGAAEGMVIQHRLANQPFERPMTHDLLDDTIRRLGGRVVQVEIAEIRADVFIGTIVVQQGAAVQRIDARSSDAVAVALGHHAPIFVAETVVARTAVPRF